MPITLPETLPAFDVLRNEGVMVMSPDRAAHQDIRPLRIGLLNLMPKKIQTENQFARLIGATPLQIDFQLIRMSDHESRNTAADHIEVLTEAIAQIPAGRRKEKAPASSPVSAFSSLVSSIWPLLEPSSSANSR